MQQQKKTGSVITVDEYNLNVNIAYTGIDAAVAVAVALFHRHQILRQKEREWAQQLHLRVRQQKTHTEYYIEFGTVSTQRH